LTGYGLKTTNTAQEIFKRYASQEMKGATLNLIAISQGM